MVTSMYGNTRGEPKASILVVEDERIVAEDIRASLLLQGYDVTSIVSSGEKALRHAEEHNPDIVLMDIVLDGAMDGVQAADLILSRYGIPSVYLTAHTDAPTLDRVKATHPQGYVVKPFEDKELGATLDMALYRAQTEKKINHLNSILRGIRNVNQLLVRERDPDRLLDGACKALVDSRGYYAAWIILSDDEKRPIKSFSAGLEAELLGDGVLPICATRVLETGRVFAVKDIHAECPACPFSDSPGSGGSLVLRLCHAGRSYGAIGVYLPSKLVSDAEERELFSEMAGDIALGIHSIRMEERRKEAEEDRIRLVRAIEQVDEAIVITDADATIRYVNPAFERVAGYTPAEALGKNPRVLQSGKHDAAFYRDLWDTLTAGRTWRGHFVNKKKDGSLYEEDAVITPASDASGRVVSYVAVKKDVTDEIAKEEQLRRSQKLEAVGELAGGIAHDFNNMLTVVMGNAAIAKSALPPTSECGKEIDAIIEVSERAAALTRQLLTFSSHHRLQSRVIDINDVVRGVEEMLRRLIPESIALTIRPTPEPCIVNADPELLEQAVVNLAINARDAMPNGGKLIIATAPSTITDAERNKLLEPVEASRGEFLCITVSDNGVGMDDETKARIFEPFFTKKPRGAGTGLGLPMVHGIIKQHGGGISVESVPEQGTAFSLYLPLLDKEEPTSPCACGNSHTARR